MSKLSVEIDFITPLVIAGLDKGTYDAVFIRAPLIETVGDNVIVLSTLLDGTIVAARENNMLATSFHPELTRDLRLHAFFLTMCQHRQ